MKPIRVVHIIPNLRMGGAERLCLDICNALVQKQNKVLLVLLEDVIEYDADLSQFEVFITSARAGINPFKSKEGALKKLQDRVRVFNPDVVHTHLFEAEFLWKTTQLNIPSFFHIHDNIKTFKPFTSGLLSKGSWLTFLEKTQYKRLLKKQNTSYLCISNSTEEYIKSTVDPTGKQIHLLHNAIDFSRFDFNEIRELSEMSLITIGSLLPNKAHTFLIDVVHELRKRTTLPIRLDILGDGVERNRIQAKIENDGMTDIVKLRGKVKNPEDFLKSSNLYIHGAFKEAFGLVLVEAMAAGLPVFSTDGGGNRDVVFTGKNGFLFKERNIQYIASEIVKLFDAKKEYQNLSKNAYEFAKGYDISIYTDKLIALYNSKN